MVFSSSSLAAATSSVSSLSTALTGVVEVGCGMWEARIYYYLPGAAAGGTGSEAMFFLEQLEWRN